MRAFLVSAARLSSSICLHPLKRASMTSVDVTSFSLKKRFTRPCKRAGLQPAADQLAVLLTAVWPAQTPQRSCSLQLGVTLDLLGYAGRQEHAASEHQA